MDSNFKFANLIGSVYRNGNVVFSVDGNTVFSPVGNKITMFDLKSNLSRTISVESSSNITALALHPSGNHLMVANETGNVIYVNLVTETNIYTYPAKRKVLAMEFSPCGKKIAICRDNDLQIHDICAFTSNTYRPMTLSKTYHVSGNTLKTVDWSDDGCLIALGGEDKVVRLVGATDYKNLFIKSYGSHKGAIVTAQFLKNSYDFVSVDSTGYCQLWTSSVLPGDLVKGRWTKASEGAADEDFVRMDHEKTKVFSVIESAGSGKHSIKVSACQLHTSSSILVTAFSNGVFVLHEIPSFSLIHNLRVSDYCISTAVFNNTGDWLALGCGVGSSAQLIVWEWQSETYVMKQQSHSQKILSSKFSPDGGFLGTGAEDGKVKIWNLRNCFCSVTFDEHTSAVTAVAWTQNGKAILSASLDGTIRAHDMKRYRNFRTLVCPEPTQFDSLVVDKAGDIVAAAGKEVFNIFLWSLENGHMLDVLAGHESNISGISIFGNSLVSTAWDRTVKVWNILDSSCESTELAQEGMDVDFSPCGQILAVLTIDSTVTFMKSDDMTHIGSIEARLDLDPGRGQTDTITREKAAPNKSFTCLCFSPDGEFILLGGDSNNFCLYSVSDRLLLKRFKVTINRSLDGVILDINRRNVSEFGNMALIDDSDSDQEPDFRRQIKLPGTKHMDLGERRSRPEIAIYDVSFCPTGRKFAICSTEGAGIYSLDTTTLFDPFQLDSQTSPKQVKRHLAQLEYSAALMASLRLNESELIQRVMEETPMEQVELVVRTLTLPYAERLLKWISTGNVAWNSPHIQFYMFWIRSLLHVHGTKLKGRADVAVLTGIQQIIAHHQELITKVADQNKYSLRYLCSVRKLKREEDEEDEKMEIS